MRIRCKALCQVVMPVEVEVDSIKELQEDPTNAMVLDFDTPDVVDGLNAEVMELVEVIDKESEGGII